MAASMMSAAGTVTAGSAIAVMQSIGATGMVSATTALVANSAFGAAVAGGAYGAYRKLLRRGGEGDNNGDEEGNDKPLTQEEISQLVELFRGYVWI